jgi:mono/diheme cytochrome c family protein
MSATKLLWITGVLLLFAFAARANEQNAGTVVKRVPMKSTSPASGHAMYKAYCAVCHGENGKGEGPAASALKVPPSNLTLLGKNNGGKFPSAQVNSAIRGTAHVTAHGSKEMPVWGQLFWDISHGDESQVQLRVRNLTDYIESLQQK